MLNPWISISAILGLLGLSLLGFRTAQRRGLLSDEASRKGVHVVMGTVAATFPVWFDATWPVFVLGAAAAGLLGLLRTAPLRQIGRVLHGVNRASVGDLCFPASVVTVFVLSDGSPLTFVVPMLILAIADPMAAFAGQTFGRRRFSTRDGVKSVEGVLAFWGAAFAVAYVPLLLVFSSPADALLIAVLVASAGAVAEAISWRGLDNLFVPLSTSGALAALLPLPTSSLLLLAIGTAGAGLLVLDVVTRFRVPPVRA